MLSRPTRFDCVYVCVCVFASQDAILSIATTFDLDTDDVIPTSAKTGEGVDEVRR